MISLINLQNFLDTCIYLHSEAQPAFFRLIVGLSLKKVQCLFQHLQESYHKSQARGKNFCRACRPIMSQANYTTGILSFSLNIALYSYDGDEAAPK